jgi:hemoglobin
MRRNRLSTLTALTVFATVAWAAAGQDRPAASPSLYERMGRYDRIATFVDTAFPRVASHQQLRRLFQGHARDSQVRQRQLIIDALCQATGGPCAYTGRSMKPVHTGLGITAADWTVFVGILGGALDELKFGAAEKKEFLALLDERFRPDVVGH